MKNQKGQVILVLILVMTVALAIGISVVQRSLSDISTSTKVEQSSRAFSAAEAGIEKALNCPTCVTTSVNFSENQSGATVTNNSLIPCVPGSSGCVQGTGSQQVALEYPPLAKEEVAHVWLADYTSTVNPPTVFYTQPTLDVYWGDPAAIDKAALELTLVYYASGQYLSRKWYLDQIVRSPANNFEQVTCIGNYSLAGYQCKKTLGNNTGINNGPLPSGLMLLRARLLYNSTSQPFAVQAVGTCATCFLPPQARKIISTGTAGTTQRRVQLFQLDKVVPQYFDYAIFSAGDINK